MLWYLSHRIELSPLGFRDTKIVGSDGSVGDDEVAAMASDPVFSAAVPVFGLHYPCRRTVPQTVYDLPGASKLCIRCPRFLSPKQQSPAQHPLCITMSIMLLLHLTPHAVLMTSTENCPPPPPPLLGPEKVVWSSEDNSGISGNWRGGGCWGRSLLQNYVKVTHATSCRHLLS